MSQEDSLFIEGFSDLDDLYVPQVEVRRHSSEKIKAVAPSRTGRKRDWVEGKFVRGPLPLKWWGPAFRLNGPKTFATAMAIWYLSGLRGRKDNLKLTTETLLLFGVTNRETKRRALEALEREGLISVVRQRGMNPKVTILDVEA